MSKTKIYVSKFTDENRKNGIKKTNIKQKEKAYNDGLTSIKRKQLAIEKASGGKWWIKQYIQAAYNWRDPDDLKGIDDE